MLNDNYKEVIKKYCNTVWFSPAYNNAFGFHNGSFYSALFEAILRADKNNTERLKKAYPELVELFIVLCNSSRNDVDEYVEQLEKLDKEAECKTSN